MIDDKEIAKMYNVIHAFNIDSNIFHSALKQGYTTREEVIDSYNQFIEKGLYSPETGYKQ